MIAINHKADLARLKRIVDHIDIGMMTTLETDGSLHSRPMMTARFEPEGVLWFFAYESSHKVDEVELHHQVNVSYASPSEKLYVSVTGTAEVVTDRAKIEELWTDQLKPWFPQGLAEPDLALLRVTVEHAEFWDGLSSMAAQSVETHTSSAL